MCIRDRLKDDFYIDVKAIEFLMKLSRTSIYGYQEAMGIIGKLIKGVCDDRYMSATRIDKPSAFVTKCVKNAFIVIGRR